MLKYKIIADALKKDIQEGVLKPGQKLPSIKSYASKMEVNTDTIIKAYQSLELEHLIYSVPRSGYYVVKSLIANKTKKHVIDLITVSPPDSINPYKDFYHCMEQSIQIHKNLLLEYGQVHGMMELRQALVKHLMNFQIFTNKHDIFITNGAQQAIYILCVMSFYNGKNKVLVEQPTYSLILEILKQNHIPVIGIMRERTGIDFNRLEEIFQTEKVKFFYLMPRFQNPTGYSYTREQKQKIITLAQKYNVYLVEDDYLGDLVEDERGDSLYSMAEKGRVIYIRSFSKTFLPGLRLGMVILPEELKEGFIKRKRVMDLNTPVLTQGALEIYLRSKMFRVHSAKTRMYYEDKMNVVKKACVCFWPKDKKVNIPDSGIYVFFEIEHKRLETLLRNLSRNKILVSDIRGCFIEEKKANIQGIRLCICNNSDQEIISAIQIISRLC